jgi:hypothetical protein
MDTIFDPIRQDFFKATPEEKVRQKLIRFMINQLNFPKGSLAVEKELSLLPHLKNRKSAPEKRRADIICFAKNIHPKFLLYPLLLIECKAHFLTDATIEQALGYNHCVGSYFVCIANKEQIKTFWYTDNKYRSIGFLPEYNQLIYSVTKNKKKI